MNADTGEASDATCSGGMLLNRPQTLGTQTSTSHTQYDAKPGRKLSLGTEKCRFILKKVDAKLDFGEWIPGINNLQENGLKYATDFVAKPEGPS